MRAAPGLVLAALLGGCHRAAPDSGPLHLSPLPTLSVAGGQLRAGGRGPLVLTCDTPAGPVVRTLPGPGLSAVPPGALACDLAREDAPQGRVTVRLTGLPPDRDSANPGGANRGSANRSSAVPGDAARAVAAGGTLRVTPQVVRLGERENWTVTADLRAPDGSPTPDGTPVTLRAESPAERLEAVRLTVSGVARWQLTPTTAGPYVFRARSGPWQAAVTATARTGLLGGQPRAVFTGQRLTLGPLRWQDGALPDDGTPVRLRALDRAGVTLWSADVPVAAGQVETGVPRLRGAVTLRAELAGSVVTFAWP